MPAIAAVEVVNGGAMRRPGRPADGAVLRPAVLGGAAERGPPPHRHRRQRQPQAGRRPGRPPAVGSPTTVVCAENLSERADPRRHPRRPRLHRCRGHARPPAGTHRQARRRDGGHGRGDRGGRRRGHPLPRPRWQTCPAADRGDRGRPGHRRRRPSSRHGAATPCSTSPGPATAPATGCASTPATPTAASS